MPIASALFLAAYLLSATSLHAPAGQPFVCPGMTRTEVERLVGEPFYGFTRLGDPHEGRLYAEYRRLLRSVSYLHGVVVCVDPHYRPLTTTRDGTK